MVSLFGRGFDSLQLHHLSKCNLLTFRKLADFFMLYVPSFFSFWGRSRGRKTGSLEPNLATVFLFLDTISNHKKT